MARPFTFAFVDALSAAADPATSQHPIVAVLSGSKGLGGLSVDWSHEGNLLVRSGDSGGAAVWTTTYGSVVKRFSDAENVLSMSMSPNGSRVAAVVADADGSVTEARLVVRSVRDTTEQQISLSDDPEVVAWSPDGSRLAVFSMSESVAVLETKTFTETRSPDSGRLAVVGNDDAVWLGADRVLAKETYKAGRVEWDPVSGVRTPVLAGFDFDAMAVSDDGTRVATVKPHYVVIRTLR